MKKHFYSLLTLSMLLIATSCSDDDKVLKFTQTQVTTGTNSRLYNGFYMLNEGLMSHNGASLDFFNMTSGYYMSDIYGEINPGVVKELGDVGNDLAVYDNKLFAVINMSNKVEVMSSANGRRIKQFNIEKCRNIAFDRNKAYVSAWSNNKNTAGKVYEIDLNTLNIEREITVGRSPEKMVVANGKLYVANSGGDDYPNFDNTVSIVNLENYEVTTKTVNTNPGSAVFADKYGKVYIASQGTYSAPFVAPKVEVIDSQTDEIVNSFDIEINKMCLVGDMLYYISSQYYQPTYNIMNLSTGVKNEEQFLSTESAATIIVPYGLTVDADTKEVYVTDASDFQSNGYVHCFTATGASKWKVEAGMLPSHIALLPK